MIFQTDQLLNFETRIVIFIVTIILIYIVQWIILLFVKRIAKWTKFISRDLLNGIQFSIRFFAALFSLYLAVNLFAVSLESLFGISAILGAIISFGSVQWVSNFISGVYILITRPFGVKDFIAIDPETIGEVVEISLNYTKIRTIDNIYHIIPNRLFLAVNIRKYSETSYRSIGSSEASKKPKKQITSTVYGIAKKFIFEEKVVRYTFNITVPYGDLQTTKLKLQEICDIYAGVFGYKPEFFLMNFGFKLTFRFIVKTHNATILIDNLRDFRNKLLEQFY